MEKMIVEKRSNRMGLSWRGMRKTALARESRDFFYLHVAYHHIPNANAMRSASRDFYATH
jgi:hypothetical protein